MAETFLTVLMLSITEIQLGLTEFLVSVSPATAVRRHCRQGGRWGTHAAVIFSERVTSQAGLRPQCLCAKRRLQIPLRERR